MVRNSDVRGMGSGGRGGQEGLIRTHPGGHIIMDGGTDSRGNRQQGQTQQRSNGQGGQFRGDGSLDKCRTSEKCLVIIYGKCQSGHI